jgi:hypothetical protein
VVCRLLIANVEKSLRLAVERVAVLFKMHEMGGVSNLYIAFHGDALSASKSQRASASVARLSHSPRMIATGARMRLGS